MRRKFVITLWSILASIVCFVGVVVFLIWNGIIGYMPDMEDLQNPVDRFASQVYTADGRLMGMWNVGNQNRIHVDFNKISPYVIEALVATEDARFYEHSGVDFVAIGRALVKRGIMGQQSAGGGSTITQQLAKQLYSSRAHSTKERLMQKPIEWIIAIKLERNFTKEEIVTMYLDQFDFLHNAVGIKNAANTYFSKEPKDLTLEESAMLVGLCKNPSYFNPRRYEERCRERRNVVLQQMEKAGYISHAQYRESSEKPLGLKFKQKEVTAGIAPYFREYLRKYMMMEHPRRENYPSWNYTKFYIDSVAWANDPLAGWCNKNLKKDGTPYDVHKDGLKIYTTIDSRMQKYAEQAMLEHLAKYLQPAFTSANRAKPNAPFSSYTSQAQVDAILERSIRNSPRWYRMRDAGYSEKEIRESFYKKTETSLFSYKGMIDTTITPFDSIRYIKSFLRSGFCSMEVKTGQVKAYVGGVDFFNFEYDMVGEGRRQVGSTIKPYLYSLAMENGLTPCDPISNSSAYANWHVKGAGGGTLPLRNALKRSLNGASTQLMKRFSYDGRVFKEFLTRNYGINLPGVEPTPTLCLGSCEISLLEMVSAYTAFANQGIRCAPLMVTRIEDRTGQVLARFEPRVNEAISAESSYKMLDMLQGVIDGGTGSRLRYAHGIKAALAGKTGTTNLQSDGWFMGITPSLVSGCWVGGEDRDIHFDSTGMGQGATMALPIFAYYIKKIFADTTLPYRPEEQFEIPEFFNPCAKDTDIGLEEDDFSIEDVFE